MNYTIVDSNYHFVKMTLDDHSGYELKIVSSDKGYDNKYRAIIEGQSKEIDRIIKNDDYYNVYVEPEIKFPLLVKGIEKTVKIIELEE